VGPIAKWICGPLPKGDSSRQVGYHIILVAEGNTVGDEIL